MKHINSFPLGRLGWAFLLLLIISCGGDKHHFAIEGRLLNITQGDFLVYSPDGAMPRVDTIHVVGGRFEAKPECEKPGTAIIMMPNGAELPLFVEPGVSLELKGDATNLKQAEVTGSKDNEIMNQFRRNAVGKQDTQLAPVISDLIHEHPSSPVGLYLIKRYLLPAQDYKTAITFLDIMIQKQDHNTQLQTLRSSLAEATKTAVGTTLPSFTAKTIDGRDVSATTLRAATTATIVAWASYDYESVQLARRLMDKARTDNTPLLLISLDASTDYVRSSLGEDLANAYHVCDGKMLDGTLPRLLSIYRPGETITLKAGKITQRNIYPSDI